MGKSVSDLRVPYSIRSLASDTSYGNPLGAARIGTLPQIDTTVGAGDGYAV